MTQRAVVRYQVATYSGEVVVFCDENDENAMIEAMAREQLVRSSGGGSLPIGCQTFRVVSREAS